MSSTIRLVISGAVAFVFYFGWSYWANSLVTDDQAIILRSALVQGLYSGGMTLMFTWLLELSLRHLTERCFSLLFVVPILCSLHSPSRQNRAIGASFNSALDISARYLKGNCIPGALVAPLVPLAVQSVLVIAVNMLNQTPNLWLTVAPSILFSGFYGYAYSWALVKQSALKPA